MREGREGGREGVREVNGERERESETGRGREGEREVQHQQCGCFTFFHNRIT